MYDVAYNTTRGVRDRFGSLETALLNGSKDDELVVLTLGEQPV